MTDQCGLIMVGSGTDTYDPICELPKGHKGSCKSSAAIDQHRLPDVRTLKRKIAEDKDLIAMLEHRIAIHEKELGGK